MRTPARLLVLGFIWFTGTTSLFAQSSLLDMLHGGHQSPPKSPPPKVMAEVRTAAGATADPQAEAFLRALAAGLKARDATEVLPLLAKDYRIDNLPPRSSPKETFRQAVERMKSPVEIVIRSVDLGTAQRTVKADFRYSADNVKTRTLQFDAAGKLLWSDVFQIQVQGMGG
jgi:hypothetical protein